MVIFKIFQYKLTAQYISDSHNNLGRVSGKCYLTSEKYEKPAAICRLKSKIFSLRLD